MRWLVVGSDTGLGWWRLVVLRFEGDDVVSW
jgi:hypothetical protein